MPERAPQTSRHEVADPDPLCEECGWTGDVLVAGLCAERWCEAEVLE